MNSNNDVNGMCGMEVMCAICFFSFVYFGVTYDCTLVHWFSQIAEEVYDDAHKG